MPFVVIISIIIIAVAKKGAKFTLWTKSETLYNSRVLITSGAVVQGTQELPLVFWFNSGGHRRPLLRDAKEKNGDASFHKRYPCPCRIMTSLISPVLTAGYLLFSDNNKSLLIKSRESSVEEGRKGRAARVRGPARPGLLIIALHYFSKIHSLFHRYLEGQLETTDRLFQRHRRVN